MHTYLHACMQKMRACIHGYTKTYMRNILAYMHAKMRACMHTYIHERNIPEPLAVQRSLICAASPKPACHSIFSCACLFRNNLWSSLFSRQLRGKSVTGQCAIVTSSPTLVPVIVAQSADVSA